MDHAEREHTCARLPLPHCVRDNHQGLTPTSAGARDLVEVFDVGAHGTVEALDLGVRRLDEVVLIGGVRAATDRKSTRLNSSHTVISYAVFCLKKKKNSSSNSIDKRARK